MSTIIESQRTFFIHIYFKTEYLFEVQFSIHPTNIRLPTETRSGKA